MTRSLVMLVLAAVGSVSCLGARAVERNYFVLHGEPLKEPSSARPVDGLVRVRDMDTDSVYEKFQIVVRRSPYQLRYSEQNVWAVKPNQMVSDLVAQALDGSDTFTGVTRELRDARPAYTMSGRVSAIELYDSGDLWFAHLSMQLHLTRFGDGASIWAFEFDERKEINPQAFEHGVRALSELLQRAIVAAVRQVQMLDSGLARRAAPPPPRIPIDPPDPPRDPSQATAPPPLLFVPERPGRRVDPPIPARVLTSTAGAVLGPRGPTSQ